jgi:hypothetical protein
MIKIENAVTTGWQAAIRGMRNPMNSWLKIDSFDDKLGENDRELMKKLERSSSDHAKYRRMIVVTMDIVAPLYWWKEFDTYKVGTVANSCSTMHKIAEKEFTLEDFSHEHMNIASETCLETTIGYLNLFRQSFLENHDKDNWWQMIQLLPSSYNQRRTILLNYEVLANIYKSRKNHKLDEWREFCKWIESLPNSFLISCEE